MLSGPWRNQTLDTASPVYDPQRVTVGPEPGPRHANQEESCMGGVTQVGNSGPTSKSSRGSTVI
jgi:hypothetical protein